MFLSLWKTTLIAFTLLELPHLIVTSSGFASKKGLPSVQELKFLQRYGYLDPPMPNSEALYKHDAVIEAIKNMQRYGAIPETGEMDNATRILLKSPRCGVPDIIKPHRLHANISRIKRYVIASDGWKKRHLTYFLSNWSPKLGSRDTVLQELKKAFMPWSDYSQLSFQHVESSDADIIVNFVTNEHGDGYSFDGPGGTLAHAFFPYDFDAFGGDVHFDNDENWIIGPGEGIDFFTVAVHELGHSLGLGHSTDSESIMFPYYKGYNPYFSLGYDDILAMYQLYVVAKFEDDQMTIQTTTSKPKMSTTSPTTSTTFAYDKEVDDEGIVDNEVTTKSNNNKTTKRPRPKPTTLRPSSPQPPPKPDTVPDICDGSYDAISTIRGELFVFKGQYMWRFRERKRLESGYPIKFREMFPFPTFVNRIDAAYEDQQGYIHFFSGRRIYIYDGNQFIDKWPRTLKDLKLKSSITKLDGSFIWAKNQKTYMFSGSEFWRFDSKTLKLDSGYPKKMIRWRGVPYPIDGALRWIDGGTYIFVGKDFYRFNDIRVYVEDGPLPVNDYWFNCLGNSDVHLKTKHKKRHVHKVH